MKRILVIAILGLCLLYGGDYLAGRSARLGAVKVDRYYAIPQKDGKTEFVSAGSETQACVQSLLPPVGYMPCWYVNRHRQKRINM
jgi:hypothetical protein